MRFDVRESLRSALVPGTMLILFQGCGSDGGTGPDGEPDYGACGELVLHRSAFGLCPLSDR